MPALRDTLRVGYPALGELNDALPTLRAFSREALPGVRSSVPTLDAAIPWIAQARALVGEDELKGLAADLRQAVPSLVKLNERLIPALRPAARAVLVHEHRAGAVRRVADPQHRGRQLGPGGARAGHAQLRRASPARAAINDANTPVFHIQGVSPTNLTAGRHRAGRAAEPEHAARAPPRRALRDPAAAQPGGARRLGRSTPR